jgi:tRNA nucleotidyltransferase (CCA-adding enzyme)
MDGSTVDPQAVLLLAGADYPPIARSAARIAIVGGFVRDVTLGRGPRELDLVVEGSAEALARSFGGELTVHDAFGTATASGQGWRIDVAMARAERYPAPGALPEVAPASIEADLARRDFSVNAIAVTLDGELIAAEHALEDLGAHRLRVLHEQSFADDPSRVLRLARYAERLGFEVEARTAELAQAATFATLSGARLGGELRLALAEPDPLAVLARVAHQLPIAVDRELLQSALALAPPGSDHAMLILGATATDQAWLETLELNAGERDIALACANATAAPAGTRPSALWRQWRRTPIEAVAVAGARGDRAAAGRWIDEIRHVSLEVGGDDLLAAGIAEGPEIGRRLDRTLAARLDGEIDAGREAELRFALRVGD